MHQNDYAMELNQPPNQSAPSELQPSLHWSSSLRFKLGVGLFLLFLILVSSNLWLIWFRGLPLLVEQSRALQAQIGETIVVSLNKQFKQAETLAIDIANMAEVLPQQDNLYLNTFPHLMNLEPLRSVIAGGGIWPEPFKFNPQQQRNSFFWGREADGSLKFYDDYNHPDGAGYHNEEWYVPTTFLEDGKPYWSKSYTDPYSRQPMVTCSVPFYRNGELSGISTIDLKLEGVNSLVKEKFQGKEGYAFVVDRNNKFIDYPNQSLVITEREGNKDSTDFIYASEFALIHPVFKPVADALEKLNGERANLASQEKENIQRIANDIAERSYQIELEEARIIAHNLVNDSQGEIIKLADFEMQNDQLLKTPVSVTIYQMPHTYWKVITVFPLTQSQDAAIAISKSITWGALGSIVLWGLLSTLFFWQVLFARLNEMTSRIRRAAKDGRKISLQNDSYDELGVMAQWYNLQTQQLHEALKAAEVSAQNLQKENNEHRVTAKLLEKSLSMQRAILDSAKLTIITLDQHGMIMNCNAGTCDMLGYGEHELVGKTFPHNLIDEDQISQLKNQNLEQFQQAANGFELFTVAHQQGLVQETELEITCKNKSNVHVYLTVTPVIGHNDQLEGWLAVMADISVQKRAQDEIHSAKEQAEKSNRAKTQFLASMSHELRTPLNSILGFTHRLQKTIGRTLNERHQDALNTIERNTSHLMTLINDLLDISKIEAGKMELKTEAFNLSDLVVEVHSDMRPLADNTPIEFSYNLPKQDVLLEGDRKKIKQIIFNLVSNSFKATEKGFIDITLSVHKDNVHIAVKDSGKGISAESSKMLFEKFNNLDHYVDDKVSTGLGLFITLQLVNMHQGTISFDSQEGKGTRFIVELPLTHHH